MATNEENEDIGEFTSTAETDNVPDANLADGDGDGTIPGESWADSVPDDTTEDVPIPDVLSHLMKNGMRFKSVPFWSGFNERPQLLKNLSVYFSVDTVVTSQDILEAFDAAGIDIDGITSIQRRTSNRSWVVSFDSQLAKETALQVVSVEIGGTTVFLGDCENRLVLVKIYEAPNELPDTAVIGRLSHYGRVLSFRRDKFAQFIENGVRTARMTLTRHIPSIVNLAGEIIRVWYPNQPKTCRNCGSMDHLVKDCSSVRCFNCECPGHRMEDCEEAPKCGVCKADDHQMADCPFILHSANVDSDKKGEKKGEDTQKPPEEKQKERPKKKKQEEKQQQRASMQIEKDKRCDQRQENNVQEQRGDKDAKERQDDKQRRDDKQHQRRDENQQQSDHERDFQRDRRDSERERRDRREYEKWKDARRRDREREERYRDREYSRRDYHRDRSSRRDFSDDDDDDPGWTVVRHKRRYDYD